MALTYVALRATLPSIDAAMEITAMTSTAAFKLTRPSASGEFQIERNIPLPAKRKSPGARAKYPYAGMDVGDSFHVVPAAGKGLDRARAGLHCSANAWALRRGGAWKFTVRVEGNGLRCWRIA